MAGRQHVGRRAFCPPDESSRLFSAASASTEAPLFLMNIIMSNRIKPVAVGAVGRVAIEKSLGTARSSTRASADHRGPAARPKTLSFWLLLVLYPFAMSLGTYPVVIGGSLVSVEFLLSLVCTFVVASEILLGKLKVTHGNPYFLIGLVIWLGANMASLLLHPAPGSLYIVFRLALKAMFGYMAFCVLQSNGGLNYALKAYVAGCVISGLFTIAYTVQAGSLELLREASFAGEDTTGIDPNMLNIDLFRGLARNGAGSLMPVWLCLVMYPSVAKQWKRAGLVFLMVYLAVLSMLQLRREYLVEAVVGLPILWVIVPRRFRLGIALSGLVLVGLIVGTIAFSESWQQRLFSETRDSFGGAGLDPRSVLLQNTPAELLDAPIFGHGTGSYPQRMSKYFPANFDLVSPLGIAAHNSFSRAAVETGMVGLLGFTLMMASLAWRAARVRSKNDLVGSVLRNMAIMIFVAVIVEMNFLDGIASNQIWFFIGWLLYLDQRLLQEACQSIIPTRRMSKIDIKRRSESPRR